MKLNDSVFLDDNNNNSKKQQQKTTTTDFGSQYTVYIPESNLAERFFLRSSEC